MSITDDTTIELQTENGSTGPIPQAEFDERLDDATRRLRKRQLTFDVGGATPDSATLKITGDVGVDQALRKGTKVHVLVRTEDGEVIAAGDGQVTGVAFKDKLGKYGDVDSTERIHTVTLAG